MSEDWRRNTVVLTGTIGSGKSTAASIFKKMGALVLSADDFARAAVEPGSSALERIIREFGQAVAPAGVLDRKKLGAIVFADSAKRSRLEEIVHPEVQRLASKAYSDMDAGRYPLVIYDCPLFFEAGLDKSGFKSSILVAASKKNSLERIIARDNLSLEQAEARLKSQIPIEQKRALANYIIENDGTLDQLETQISELYAKLIAN